MKLNKKQFFVLPDQCVFLLNFTGINIRRFYPFLTFHKNNFLQIVNFDTKTAVNFRVPSNLVLIISDFKTLYVKQVLCFSKELTKILPAFCRNIQNLLITVSYGWFNILQLVGFRYRQRWYRNAQVLRYKFGYNKEVWFKCPVDFVSIIRKISPKKSIHFFYFHDKKELDLLRTGIFASRPATLYKGRGVNLKEQPMVLKEGKRALW